MLHLNHIMELHRVLHPRFVTPSLFNRIFHARQSAMLLQQSVESIGGQLVELHAGKHPTNEASWHEMLATS
jgi:hypothetical protein